MRSYLFSLIATLSICLGVVYADERSEALDREATTLYQQVFSPFCPGRSLNDCPSSKAAELKDEMRAELEAGKSGDEILRGVFHRFGDQYRAVPKFAGVGVLVWVAPVSFVLFGVILAVTFATRRKKTPSVNGADSSPELSEEEERRIQEELSRLE